MEYDEEAVLTKYIWDNYYGLLTHLEKLAAKAVANQAKSSASGSRMASIIAERWGEKLDPQVVEALEHGPDEFRRRVRDRILHKESDKVVINRCPVCQRIVRTPKAKQCLWCGHDWHQAGCSSQPPMKEEQGS